MNMQIYYKYIPLRDLRRFVEILINERLYAARFTELNDPMEGMFMVDFEHRDLIDLLKREKYNVRICSLTTEKNNALMWSHYADGHRGCCIELSLKSNKLAPSPIIYSDQLPHVEHEKEGRNVLLCKSPIWKYENEIRVFSKSRWVGVNIHSITFGCCVARKDFEFYRDLVSHITPSIQIKQIDEHQLENCYSNF